MLSLLENGTRAYGIVERGNTQGTKPDGQDETLYAIEKRHSCLSVKDNYIIKTVEIAQKEVKL
jgi:hypothetical protein